jgi:hypothetical protein
MMICSYADESADSRVYSVSALLGRLSTFVELGRQWRLALIDEDIGEIHAARLENRRSPYDRLERDQRDRLQRRFIGLITRLPIWGFHSFVELTAHKKYAVALRKQLDGYDDPHLFAFRMAVEVMAIEIDDYRVKNEPIAFVFDQHQQHESKARELYDKLSLGDWPLAHRLGSITFGSRATYVELQAADLWAYEARKNISDSVLQPHSERWQLTLFKEAGRFNLQGYTENELPRMIERMEREADEAARKR